MPKCNFCSADLTDADVQAGVCSSCGRKQGPEEDPGRQTHDATGGETISEADATGDRSSGEQADDSQLETYVPSAEEMAEVGAEAPQAADAAPQGSPQQWDATSIERTLVPEDLPQEVVDSLQATWSPAIAPETEPGMTVKAESVVGTGDQTVGGPEPGDQESSEQAPPSDQQETWGWAATDEARVGEEGEKPTRRAGMETALVIKHRSIKSSKSPGTAEEQPEYELVDQLGEGGMGVVWRARQTSIDRFVAIKMIKSQQEVKEQRQKFLAEAVVTGDLEHPNIVPIYDVASTNKTTLFYAMKQVEGTPWMDVIGEKSLHENLEILMNVADAVAFAHSRGVVHRDLKPENVMLGGFGEVLVMDWGLALPTPGFRKSGSITRSTNMGGTPAYMAPEMAKGPIDAITPASDVYLLGAILYEIVTGSPPHVGTNAMKCLMAAARNEIVPTDKTGELIDIALTAMAADPEDRFASVQDFQAAIRDYQSHTESIALSTRAGEDLEEAKRSEEYQLFSKAVFAYEEALALWEGNNRARDGVAEAKYAYAECAERKGDYDLAAGLLDVTIPKHAKLSQQIEQARAIRDAREKKLKFAKRAGLVGAAVFLITVTGLSVWANLERIEANNQRAIAEQRRRQALAARDAEAEARQEAVAQRDRAIAAEEDATEQRDNAIAAREQEKEARIAAQKAQEAEKQARMEADQRRREAVAARDEAEVQRAKAEYQAYIAGIGLAAAKIEENAFDAARAILDSADQNLRNWEWGRLMHLCSQHVQTFDAGSRIEAVAVDPNPVADVPDGKRFRFVTAGWDGVANLWQVDVTQNAQGRVQVRQHAVTPLQHDNNTPIHAVAISPDSRYVATAGGVEETSFIRLWETQTGNPVPMNFQQSHTEPITSVAFSPDGSKLVTGSFDDTARIWNVESGEQIHKLHGHFHWVWDVAFSSDGTKVVTAGQDGIAIVWDVKGQTARALHTFRGHQGPVYSAAFSPDGQWVATGGYDRRVLLWKPDDVKAIDYEKRIAGEPEQPPPFRALEGHTAPVRSVAFSQDGTQLLSGGHDNTVKVWSPTSGQAIKTFRGHASWVRACAFAPNGRWILSGSYDSSAKVWAIEQYEEFRVLRGRQLVGHKDVVLSAAFSQDGDKVVTASRDLTAKLWEVGSGRQTQTFQEGHDFLASNAVFFPDGRKMITAALDNTARIWDVTTGTQVLKLAHTGRSAALALSENGKWLLTGSDAQTAKLWNLEALLQKNNGSEPEPIQHVGQEEHRSEVTAVAVSPALPSDGSRRSLLTADRAGRAVLWEWDGQTLARKHVLKTQSGDRAHSGRIVSAAFLPGGQRVLTASADHTVAQWEVATGRELTDLGLRHDDAVLAMALSTTGKEVVTSCADGTVRVWDADAAQEIRRLPVEAGLDGTALENLLGISEAKNHQQGCEVTTVEAGSAAEVAGINPGDVIVKFDGQLLSSVNDLERLVREKQSGDAANVEFRIKGQLQGPVMRKTVRLHVPTVSAVAVFQDDDTQRVLTVNSQDKLVRIWDLKSGKRLPNLDITGDTVWSAEFGPNGAVLTVQGNSARLWNLTDESRQIMDFSPHGAVASANFSPDGRFVITGSWDSSAKIWDTADGRAVAKIGGQNAHAQNVNSALFSPKTGKQILTASDDGTAKLWNFDAESKTVTFNKMFSVNSPVNQAVFSDDETYILTASDDGSARIWDAASGQELCAIQAHQAPVLCVAFSKDTRWVVTGSADNTARIWKVMAEGGNEFLDPREPVVALSGHTAGITSVAFSPDAKRVLTASEDNTAKLWDTPLAQQSKGMAADGEAEQRPGVDDGRNAREILTLSGHTREVTSASFSPTGTYVLTGSRDGTAIIWLAQSDWTPPEREIVAAADATKTPPSPHGPSPSKTVKRGGGG